MRVLLTCILSIVISNFLNARDTLCTPDPSREAVAVYRLLNDYKNQYILSGQQDSYLDGTSAYVYVVTKKYPAIRGFDFMTQANNTREVTKVIEWWNQGGIPTIMWHWGAPSIGEGYEASKQRINIDNCFIPGTAEYNSFWSELEMKGKLLTQLRDSGVPVIWRPFHELNGGWFWWSMSGSAKFKQLWITMYNYYTYDLGLNNLIWTLCYTSDAKSTWYPGDKYVDIAGADLYNGGDGPQKPMYDKVKSVVNDQLPIAYHECGIPPQPEQCIRQDALWSWWMEWSGNDWVKSIDREYLKYLYNHDVIISRDELPDVMETYNWNDTCDVSAVTTYMKIDSGQWMKTNKIPYDTIGEYVYLKVETPDLGNWRWQGYGVVDSSIVEQKVKLNGLGTIEVVFTNACGAVTTKTFHISEGCLGTPIIPYVYSGGTWSNTNTLTIKKGQSVLFGPQPVVASGWEWTGPNVKSYSRELSVKPDSTSVYIANFTNDCGKTTTKEFTIIVDTISNLNDVNTNDMSVSTEKSGLEYLLHVSSKYDNNFINIYTISGLKILAQSFNDSELKIDLNTFESGCYVVEIMNAKGRYVQKIIL